MAFHVACPITCRKICFCIPGTPAPLLSPRGRESFLQDVLDLENLLAKPAFLAAGGEETVEVLVPRLAKDLKAKKAKSMTGQTGGESGEDTPISLSKKAVMRKKATMAAIAVAEAAALAEQAKKAAEAARLGAARQLTEAGAAPNGIAEGATCEICFYSEVIGSKRADRMVPCPNCKKLFHRNCLKRWAGNRDLFNWSSWVCGSCRICEVCRRMGEPNKLMFCKRCDGAFHAYCQQPPLKHVPKGPFLCPKHTVCHSCASRVPGSGVSSRWFLEYTTCDSCGRLFIKGKYCSICLKVYRDSEASPMVCCDNCEHWVHAHCDGISDEKYHEFQLDNNLHYTCAACRGDSHRVRDMDDAADELWRRRDEADRDLIRQYQAAAGVPSKDENLKLCPSDDEDDYKVLENRLMKKAVKVLPLKGKDRDGKPSKKFEFGKHKTEEMEKPGTSGTIKKLKITLPKSHMSKSKGDHHNTEERRLGVMEERGHHNASFPQKIHKKKNSSVVKLTKYMIQARESIAAGNGKITLADQNAAGAYTNAKSTTLVFDEKNMLNRMKNKHAAEQIASPFENKGALENPVKTVKFVNNANDKAVTNAFLPLPVKEKGIDKTVMKIRPVLATMREDKLEARRQSHQFHSDEEGSEGTSDSLQEGGYAFQSPYLDDDDGVALHQNMEAHTWGVYGDNVRARRRPSVKYRDKDSNVQKPAKSFEDMYEDEESDSNDTSSGKQGASSILAKRMQMDATSGMSPDEDSSGSPRKRLKSYLSGNLEEEELANKDSVSKVSFKLKLKQPMSDNDVVLRNAERESSPKHGNGNALRGQRSKRKKHHSLETGKPAAHEQEAESHVKEEGGKLSDDNWILQKLGRDAVGKRVEVFRLRDRSWCKGKVTEVSVLQSQFTVSFDDGRLETIEFGKRSVRLLSHLGKHLRS